MRIARYSFGNITVDGKRYTSDVVVYPDRVDPSWWRREGHSLYPEDIADAINARPDVIIIGTGYSGMMRVFEDTIQFIKSKGIDVQVARTGKAVDIFNSAPADKKIIAALHITC